jgi:glycosyltransferase involved in cell wall biosynthesis
MKKILIFIDWYEPGFQAGGPIRSIKNLVDRLKGEAEFFIFTRDRDYQSNEAYENIPADKWLQTALHVQVFYCSPQQLTKSTIQHILQAPYDSIYINGIFSRRFSLLPLFLLSPSQRKKTILAPRGMLAAGALGVKSWKKKLFLRGAKAFNLFKNISFHATNAIEANDIYREIGPKVAVYISENLGSTTVLQEMPVRKKEQGSLQMVSIARISPEKNTLYTLQLLEQYGGGSEQLRLDLYGPVNDEAYWQECRKLMAKLPANIVVSHKGSIANNLVAETLQKYHLFLLPSRGENFGHGILEALKAAVPVLISDKTPWRGLAEVQAGLDLPLEQPEAFLEAMQRFAQMDGEEYRSWMIGAFALAKRKADQSKTLEIYRQMFGLQ